MEIIRSISSLPTGVCGTDYSLGVYLYLGLIYAHVIHLDRRVICVDTISISGHNADISLLRSRFLWPPYGIGQAIIFLPCGFFLSFFFLFFLA